MPSETRERALQFVDLMLERVEIPTYPSKDLLDRIERALVLFWEEEQAEGAR